jgi:hypothetical protein
VSHWGTPTAVGGYLVGPYDTLTSAQVSFLEGKGAAMVLIYSADETSFTTQGASDAAAAVQAADNIGATGGVAIYIDIEASYTITSAFVNAWYSSLEKDGYIPGFYESSYKEAGSGKFEYAFCGASSDAISGSYLYSSELQQGSSYKESDAPSTYNPYYTGCESLNQMSGWQYLDNSPAPEIDADEFAQVGLYG